MKKIILILLLLVTLTGCGKTNNEETNNEETKKEETEEIKYITSDTLKEEKEISGLKLEFISLEYNKGISTLKVRVTNESDIETIEKYVNILYKNKEGNIVYTALGYIKKLSPKEDTILIVNDTIDLSNVESVEYEVIE